MLGRIRPHLTYANVMSTLAVFGVLGGGTAIAAIVISSNRQVARNTISGHSPPNGAHPNIISGSIDSADLAGGSVGTGKFADGATAPNARRLGGSPAGAWQRRVHGSCDGNRAVSAVSDTGSVQCARSVFPIAMTPANDANETSYFNNSFLSVLAGCGTGNTYVRFANNHLTAATLNWRVSEGGTTSTVNASGDVIAGSGVISFVYANRLEGQWIYSTGGEVTTVNLHAFRSPDSCEVRGTAEVALTG
jgi:hypothetical protein